MPAIALDPLELGIRGHTIGPATGTPGLRNEQGKRRIRARTALEFAEASPWPTPDVLERDVYADS